MKVFESLAKHNHEEIVFCHDKDAGLRAIIAIHDTTLGPSLGGARMWPYKTEEEALQDVLRLSRGMTYKSALAGLPFGGGKDGRMRIASGSSSCINQLVSYHRKRPGSQLGSGF